MKNIEDFSKKAIKIIEDHQMVFWDPGALTQIKLKHPRETKYFDSAYNCLLSHYMGVGDPRVSILLHCVNYDFFRRPIYLMGTQKGSIIGHVILTSFYIFPEYRRMGLGSLLLELTLLRIARSNPNAIVQVACDFHDKKLHNFYLKNGFVSSGFCGKDVVGNEFIDFFYCYNDLEFTKDSSHKGDEFDFKRVSDRAVEHYTDLPIKSIYNPIEMSSS